jgi:hypothetical protein
VVLLLGYEGCCGYNSSSQTKECIIDKIFKDGRGFIYAPSDVQYSVLQRIRIRIHMFLGLPDPDPDPLVRGMDPDPLVKVLNPDPSIIMKNSKKNLDS